MADKKKGEVIEKGISIVGENNTKVTVNYLISDAGGQGDVYHATYKGKDYALKWYCKHSDDVIGGPQYGTIFEIYGEKNKPGEEFVWPLFLVNEENPADGKLFGYLMELLPDGYYEMADYLRMDTDPKVKHFSSYAAMLTAGLNIVSAMQKLHLKGWSYKDLNPKNFVIRPQDGKVLVVDNDNVSVDGDLCSVKGTKGYMAPEIPKSNYKVNPTMETDRYSLAVVLYRLFFIDHPMEGKAWENYPLCTDKVEDYLYAVKPVFHFDPKNDANRPTEVYAPNATARWRVVPQELRNTFITAFTEGVSQPLRRPPESEWIASISKSRDKLIRFNAEREQFVNFDDIRTVPPRCLGMKIKSNLIALYPQKAIYEVSVDKNDKQFANLYAGIVYNKNTGNLMIRNMTSKVWRGYSPDTKQLTDIGKGQDYEIKPGVMIEFQRENPRIVGEIFDPRASK